MGCLLILLAALGAAQAQVGFDRLGGDYTSFPVRSGDPAQCAGRCERDQRCRAWAFSYPVTENAAAICWLKSRVPPRVASSCCVSGVRGAGVIEPRSDPIEFGIDRYGGDFRNLELRPIRPARAAPPPAPGRRNAGLDLCPARLCGHLGHLLSQGSGDQPATPSLLHLGVVR